MAQNRLERQLLAGIRAARQGNKERARELLEGVLRQDRTNEQAWIFLASAVDSERERRMSLERIVRINPGNRPAQQALNDMVGVLGSGGEDLDVEAMSRAARTPIPDLPTSGGNNRAQQAQEQSGGNNLLPILAVVAILLGLAFLGLIFAPQFLGGDPEPTLVAFVEPEVSEEPEETVDPLFTPDTSTPRPTATFSGTFVTVERDATLPPTFTPEPSATPSVTPTLTPTLRPREDYSFLILGVQGVAEPAIYRLNGDGAGLLPLISSVSDFDYNPNTGTIVYTQTDTIIRPTDTPTPTPVASDTPTPTPTQSAFVTPRPNNTDNNNEDNTSGGGIGIGVGSATEPNEVIITRMYIASIDSPANAVEITTSSFNTAMAPAISPDGETIALSSTTDGDAEIYLYDIASGRFTQLTNNVAAIDTDPEWSPDGTLLVFASDRDSLGRTELYTMDPFADNPEETVLRVTDSRNNNRAPEFSPDGERLAYLSESGDDITVRVINVDGDAAQSLTFAPNLTYSPPSWTADGNYVLYSQADPGNVSQGLRLQNPETGTIENVRVANLDVLAIVGQDVAPPEAQAEAEAIEETDDDDQDETDSDAVVTEEATEEADDSDETDASTEEESGE